MRSLVLLDQDAYWVEYGHSWVLKYAKASDVRVVLLGLLLLVSFFAYGIQHTRYTTAVKYLRKAAEGNLGPKQGGSAAVRESEGEGRRGRSLQFLLPTFTNVVCDVLDGEKT